MNSSPSDVLPLAIRKAIAFRLLATRPETTATAPPLADMDRIQSLILQARQRTGDSTVILRKLLLVSVNNIDRHRDREVKIRHDQLLKARTAAEDAAAEDYLTLPVDLPEFAPRPELLQKAWDLIVNGVALPPDETTTHPTTPPEKAARPEPAIPIHIDRRKRYTLAGDSWYRIALTDSGRIDDRGRHIFFEEEWIERGDSVIRTRRRVAVDPATGDHVLVKRYPPDESHGSLNDLYPCIDRDYLWYIDPVGGDTEPSLQEVESALSGLAASREEMRTAARDFRSAIHGLLGRQDRQAERSARELMDSGLDDSLREALYAIRCHLAGVPAVLDAEQRMRHAVSRASDSISVLEQLASWSNRVPAASPDAAQWLRLVRRAECEIRLSRIAEAEALASLPPDTRNTQDAFPALRKDMIVRIRRVSPRYSRESSIRFLQEIWRMESGSSGQRSVLRTATIIAVESATGDQLIAGRKTKYYDAASGDALEAIFDENGSDEILVSER